jgi:hypothetical protein
MTLRKLFSLIALMIFSGVLFAQDENTLQAPEVITGISQLQKPNKSDSIISIKFDVRADGIYNNYGMFKEGSTEKFGFSGRYLNFAIAGNISDKFSYSFRYRINQDNGNPKDFFGSVDWVYLAYQINKNFSISAGKEVVAVGGYEYDKAPIDVYFWSDFWNNLDPPFRFGTSFNFHSSDGNHTLKLQVTDSPFCKESLQGLFAYNLLWYGKINWFETIYSVNFLEYEKGEFINYIALGNKFNFDWFSWELDYTNRASFKQDNFFADFSVVSNMNFAVGDHWNLFVKGGYDQNKAQEGTVERVFAYDRYVAPGTQYAFYGAGVEFYPIKSLKNLLRVHAFVYGNNAGGAQSQLLSFNIGVRWQMKVFQR